MLAELGRTGSARGLIAVHSAVGFLKLRLGALPEADAGARIAQRVMDEGDFAPGLPFCRRGPRRGRRRKQANWTGSGTCWSVSRPTAAHLGSAPCSSATSPTPSSPTCDASPPHGRSVWLCVPPGWRTVARRAGPARRVGGRIERVARGSGAGQVTGGAGRGAALRRSAADRGGAPRRGPGPGRPVRGRPLASRIREELTSAGARPRREQRRGAESLTPAELRVARLAAEAKTNGLQQATSKSPGTSSRNAAKTAARGARASRPAPTPRSPAGAHRADPALGSHRQLHTVRAGIAPPAQGPAHGWPTAVTSESLRAGERGAAAWPAWTGRDPETVRPCAMTRRAQPRPDTGGDRR